MKQRITAGQVGELSFGQTIKLAEIMDLSKMLYEKSPDFNCRVESGKLKKEITASTKELIAEKCSIGQMIEILAHRFEGLLPSYQWRGTTHIVKAQDAGWFEAKEPCDALWEAVKVIL